MERTEQACYRRRELSQRKSERMVAPDVIFQSFGTPESGGAPFLGISVYRRRWKPKIAELHSKRLFVSA